MPAPVKEGKIEPLMVRYYDGGDCLLAEIPFDMDVPLRTYVDYPLVRDFRKIKLAHKGNAFRCVVFFDLQQQLVGKVAGA